MALYPESGGALGGVAVRPIGAVKPLIRIGGVTKTYSTGMLAVAKTNLDIGRGEFISLLGPSGCGKSTLLRLVAGLAEPSSGTIEWPTSDYDATGRPMPKLGFVFQEPTLMPWATVFDNIYLPLRLSRIRRNAATDRIRAALASVGLERFADAYPRQLSGGMKMRVSIARALVTEPAILLMDEPFAALDEITRFRLNDDLLKLFQAYELTVIFVTHSVFESVYLSNRVLVMSARPGRVIADLPIAAPYPRGDDFRTSQPYSEMCRVASAELHRAMGDANEEH
ncbi:MAG: transporter nucleotide binding/ATPase protein [Rhodospirillales bacterium]|nr:transporter nucleotide binding/ATPase protein [Rhodospirillales bacterium]